MGTHSQRIITRDAYVEAFDTWFRVQAEKQGLASAAHGSADDRKPEVRWQAIRAGLLDATVPAEMRVADYCAIASHTDPGFQGFVCKSNYLARRLYGGEVHRTIPCPIHKGYWSGLGVCVCHMTGWLPAHMTLAQVEVMLAAVSETSTSARLRWLLRRAGKTEDDLDVFLGRPGQNETDRRQKPRVVQYMETHSLLRGHYETGGAFAAESAAARKTVGYTVSGPGEETEPVAE